MTDESIFTTALDITDVPRRAAYLEAACADDPARRARVEQLLAASGKAGEFLERPAAAPDPALSDTRTLDAGAADPLIDARTFLLPSPRPDALGRIGHYDVLEILGRGGFGIVFRAFDDTLQRVVAVKVLSPQMAATSPARKRFLREARSSAQVRHENVVQVYDVSRDDEPLPYLVMEFIPGETLQQRLDRTGPLAVAEVVRIGRQIAEGLAAAHETGLIHRDVKPANALIETGPHERAKLTDFGLARAADDASISQSGVVAGTPMYMSPEQAKGEALDHRSDLFSLGSVLYTLLSGRPPFRANSTLAVLNRVCEEQPRPIREVIPEVPEWLCRIVEKLHAKSPADRFQTAREVADLLADCEKQLQAHGALKDAGRIPAEKPAPRHTGSRWKRAALAAVVLVALVGAVWAGPHALRYYGNRAEVEFPPDADVVEVVLTAEDAPGERRVVTAGTRTVQLPPGAYRVEAKCRTGRAVEHWEVTVDSGYRGWLSARTHPRGGETFVLGVNRGERFIIRPVTVDLAVIEKRNRDAIDGNRLADIAKAVHAVGTDGWVQLFNGKDLTGWKNHPDQPGDWKVEDGVLVGRGRMALLYSGRGDYRDYDLRIEAKVNKGGYGGVFVRVPEFPPIRKNVFEDPKGHCVVMSAESRHEPSFHTGSLKTWTPKGHLLQAYTDGTPPGEWFTLEVLTRGPEVIVRVNGKRTAFLGKVAESAHEVGPKGFLVLEAQGDDTVIHVRKIEIKELPPGSPVAPAAPPSPAVPIAPPPAVVPFGPEQARQHQQKWAEYLSQPIIQTSATTGMTFALVPPGEFLMGSTAEEIAAEVKRAEEGDMVNYRKTLAAETPQHKVRLTRPFAIGTHEVTVEQFAKFAADTTWPKRPAVGWILAGFDGPKLPASNVSWADAAEFCKWLSARDGLTYRLPTEAEWEYACRAGTATRAYWGDKSRAKYAAGRYNTTAAVQPVGALEPNAFGLYDMCGNVWEWCSDWYDADYYRKSPTENPTGPASGTGRSLRGGSAFAIPNTCCSTFRGTDGRSRGVGFRVVLEPAGAPGPVQPAVVAFPFDAKKAEEYQEAWATFLGTKIEFADKKVGMEFRVIPPGDFQMGAKDDEVNPDITRGKENKPPGWQFLVRSLKAETPRHPVRITRPFAIGKFEVTVGQFRKFVEAAGYKTTIEQKGGYGVKDGAAVWGKDYSWKNVGYEQADLAPVWNVTREDAVEFCKWLSKEDGRTFRLPTEAEWEWACRAGTDTRTFWGGDKPADAVPFAWGSHKSGHKPQPVGGLKPNAFGLYDTCGNVWEWCSDWFSEAYYKDSPATDPPGPATAQGGVGTRHRVQRGGGVHGGQFGLCSTARSVHDQEMVGFRVVCEIAGDVKLPPEPKKVPEPNPVVVPLRDAVAAQARFRETVQKRFEAGVASKLDLLVADVELTEARIKLAEAERSPDAAADLLEELVAFRQEERDLIALRVKVGKDTRTALDAADARLADAKARLVKLRPPESAPEPRPKP